MKRKNEIEQKLDEKEFESELQRYLSHKDRKNDFREAFLKDKNPYVIAALNFFGTAFIILVFYWMIRFSIRVYSLGFLGDFFFVLDPLVYGVAIALGIIAVIKKKSPLDYILNWL